MYICICNEITEDDLLETPELIEVIGTQCGKCKEERDFPMTGTESWADGASMPPAPPETDAINSSINGRSTLFHDGAE
jgi:hypothetical protein